MSEEIKGGPGKIHLHPNAGKGGFHNNPQNINKKGSKPSIKKALEKLLEKDGELKIPKSAIISETEKFMVIKMPKQDSIALRLMQWSMSNDHKASLKAIEMIMTRMDGLALKDQQVETIGAILGQFVVDDSHASYVPPVQSEKEASEMVEDIDHEEMDVDEDED